MAVPSLEEEPTRPARPAEPRLTLVQAVQRNLPLALAPVVVLVIAAVAIGLTRSPNYSSDAQLNVGGVNLAVQSVPGYTVAVAQLAVTYSRAVDATQIIDDVSRQTGLSANEIRDSMSAAPVEGAPVVRVHAVTGNGAGAERLANAVAAALVTYATQLNRNNPDTARLLRSYQAASRQLRAARSALERTKDPREQKRRELEVATAQLRRDTDAALYSQSRAGGSTTSLVQQIAPASTAISDRRSVLERLLLAAVVAGSVIGAGLALMRSQPKPRRIAPHA